MSSVRKDIEWYEDNIKQMNITLSARSNDLQKLKKANEEVKQKIGEIKEEIKQYLFDIEVGKKIIREYREDKDSDMVKLGKYDKLTFEVKVLKEKVKKLKEDEFKKREEYNKIMKNKSKK
jgi:chromosome segregation ATPase